MKKKIVVVILIMTIVILLAVFIFCIVKYTTSKNKEAKNSNVSAIIVGGENEKSDNQSKNINVEKIIEYTTNVYFYDISDVKFTSGEYTFKLKKGLKSSATYIDTVIEQVKEDEKSGKIQSITLSDGRSTLYMYDKFFIFISYSSVTDKDIYFGKPNIDILKKHKKEKEEKLNEYSYSVYFRDTQDIELELKGVKTKLKEKLENGEIHIDDVIEQANEDEKNKKVKVFTVMDGGSKSYAYDNFFIYKQYSLSGERDVFIRSKN